MAVWMMYALVVLVLWGFTGITQKVATNYTSASLTLASYAAAYAPVTVIILWKQPLNWRISAAAWFLGILSGVLNGFGSLTIFAACRHGGKASVVTLLVALFPLLTIALSVLFLHERIQTKEIAAIALAIAAAVALSYEKKSPQPGSL
jgi:drug/metabolite transporter (DMT)-like permease